MKNSLRNLLRFLAVFSFIAVLAGANAFATDAPLTPQHFSASYSPNTNAGNVLFSWSAQSGGTEPVLFLIYKADKQTENLADFTRYQYVKVMPNQLDYKILYLLGAGDYSFYVTAAAFDGNILLESQPSAFAHVTVPTIGNHDYYIKILSQPNTQAQVGQTWDYQLKWDSNINCNIDVFQLTGNVPPGMNIDNTGHITFTPTAEGQYDIAVTVGTSCKINVQPATQKFTLVVGHPNNQHHLIFTSKPNPAGEVGKEYNYQVTTQSDMDCPVTYALKGTPMDGVTFDPNTGLLKILANQPTIYVFYIVATQQCQGLTYSATQQFSVQIGTIVHHDPCATIFGTVTYDDGTPVMEAKVKFSITDVNIKNAALIAVPVQNGQYKVSVPEGTYISDIDGNLVHEYYQDAATIDKATKITVKCGDQIVVNYVVTKLHTPVHHTISGTVTKASDNSPVITTVEFIPVEYLNGNNKTNATSRFITKTDQNGNYTITLPDNFTYIGHALQPPNTLLTDQFYNNVTTPFEADIIELTGDVTGINFALVERPSYNNGFEGIVQDSNGNPVKSRVFAYLVSQNNQPVKVNSVLQFETDVNGLFKFVNLIPGDYVLLSIPADRALLPGYYKENDYAVLVWKTATKITVGQDFLTGQFIIKHKARTGLKGIIKVDGTVNDIGGIAKKGDKSLTGSGLPGAFVYVLDSDGNVSDFAFTDANGVFSMTEVAQGSNTLIVDMVGYSSYQQNLTNDYAKNASSNVGVSLQKEEALSAPDNTFSSNGVSLYPVPAANTVTVAFNATTVSGSLRIYDLMGAEVYSQNIETVEGLNQLTINVNNLMNGTYFIRLNAGSVNTVVPLNIAR